MKEEERIMLEKARQSYFQKDFQAALHTLTTLISKYPENNAAYFMRGEIKLRLRDLDGSLVDSEKAIKLAPKAFGIENAYNNRGLVYQFRGENDKALENFNKAIRINNRFAPPYNGRGVILEKLGKTEEALEAFSKAIDLDPNGVGPYVGRSDIRFQTGDFQGALSDINKVVEGDPSFAAPWIRRAILYGMLDAWELSLSDLRRGFEIASRPENRFISRLDITFADLDKFIKNNPKSANGLAVRGLINLLQKRDQFADSDFVTAFSLDEGLRPKLDNLIKFIRSNRTW